MGKSHRDNHKARIKRGPVAFAKKAKRRRTVSHCKVCGNNVRVKVAMKGICPPCLEYSSRKAAGRH